ncbi:unnamed protein product [Effrenium voratum]|uniref:RING-type domain-containing protein n=1 Tax=Effrenium voratum TaxID=2562239 RepID=A0AA36IUK7_9DINO|nr:unnamed protein product [Effrenium voratum]CAJ1394262.1 unnamed protein product [Effrenium voratum]CAJ1434770.1 unnamed protein product [Effrenium voratum]
MPSLLQAGMSEFRTIFGMSSSSRGDRPGPPPPFPDVQQGSGGVPVWVSIDPRSGELSAYPQAAVHKLEHAYARHSREVRLAGLGLGPVYETLIVDFHGERPVQKREGGGKRDVRRFVVDPSAPPQVTVHVVRERGWRISDIAVPGVTEERVVMLDAPPPPPPLPPPDRHFLGTFRHPSPEDLQERAANLEADDAAELVGLWEWCRVAEAHGPSQLSDEDWAAYSAANNTEIEAAFRDQAVKVQITIGIRSYDVLFEGSLAGGKQVDTKQKKRRLVRRRAVTAAVREACLQGAESAVQEALRQDPSLADAECVICAEAFADTFAMPVVQLPCGHKFHGACAQSLADRRKTCPYCRAEVDWKQVREVHMFGGESNLGV